MKTRRQWDEMVESSRGRRFVAVHESRAAEAARLLRKLQGRASKLGTGALAMRPVETFEEFERRTPSEWGGPTQIDVWHGYELIGKTPKLKGWRLVGTIDGSDEALGEGRHMVRMAPGELIPDWAREADPQWCDHCGKRRRRSETFIVQNARDEQQQVGRQCLKDFLGPDAQALLQAYTYALDLDACSERDEEGGGCEPAVFDMLSFLTASRACIRLFGWVSRAKAREQANGASTSDRALRACWGTSAEVRRFWRDEVTDEDRDLAKAAFAWRANIWNGEVSDYAFNMRAACEGDVVTPKTAGFAASILGAYDRHLGAAVKATRGGSRHLGEPQQRAEWTAEIAGVHITEGRYGTTTIVRFLVDGRDKVTWFASGSKELEIGAKVTLKATIKKHEEYKGAAVTIVTRAVVTPR